MSFASSPFFRLSNLASGIALALTTHIAIAQQGQTSGAEQPAAPPDAQPNAQTEEILVFGRSLELVGTAEAASEGTIAGADLLVRPMLRVAELLEAVPGMVAVQHSGSG